MAELPTSPVPACPAGALSIFLSSTIDDYEALRRQVRDVLLEKAECACFLSEHWIGGYDETVEKCRQRVLQAQGFILLLGHWYGSIPPRRDKSITHLEFEWASDKWKPVPFPRMAVLRPKPGSRVDEELRAQASRLVSERFGSATEHAARLAAFHGQVDDRDGEWRTIQLFKDLQDLRETVLVIGRDWRGYNPLAAAQGLVQPASAWAEPGLREDELGMLGREAQHLALKKALAGLAGQPQTPAVALVVHGAEGAGQRAFMAYGVASLLKGYHPKRRIGRLPPGSTSIPALTAWFGQCLGLRGAASVETPAQLADEVAAELRHQPLYVVIDRIGDLDGGLPAFQAHFWQPLWQRLRALRRERQLVHRLVVLVADHGADAAAWGDAVRVPQAGMAPDHEKLVALPRLEPFTRDDVLEWLDFMEVPDDAAGRRLKLADRLLTDPCGCVDGTPRHVFDRLLSENLWPEGERS